MTPLRPLIILALAILVGCGGGGPTESGGGGNGGGDGGGNGGGNGGGDGGGGTELVTWTDAELADAIEGVENIVRATMPSSSEPLEDRDLIGEIEAVAAALAEEEDVLAVHVMRSSVTAHAVLRNGTSFLIVNNRPADDVDPPAGAGGASLSPDGGPHASALASRSPSAGSGPTQGPPRSTKAVTIAIDGGGSVAGEVGAMLSNAGYEVTSQAGFVEEMRQLSGLGALYLDTHLASFMPAVTTQSGGVTFGGPNRLGLQTNSLVGVSTLGAYRTELLDGDIVVSMNGGQTHATFAITESFIEKNWSFEDAVVMVHACFAGAPAFSPDSGPCYGSCANVSGSLFDPTPIQDAILGAGADMLVSFDNYTIASYARPSILYFFDRMLGGDAYEPPSPLARPFPGDQVRDAIVAKGLHQFFRPSWTLGPLSGGGNNVNLTFHGSLADGKLAPSIERFRITDDAAEPTGEMTLEGAFGDHQGEVLVNGRSIAVESWTDAQIVARVPYDGYAGEVVVRTPPDGVKSNAVPLTEWIGTMTFSFTPGQGTLKAEAAIDTRFRADVHRHRSALDDDPSDPDPVVAYISPGSEGETEGSGSHTEGGTTVRYTGGDPIRIISKAEADGPPIQPTPFDGESIFGGRVHLDPAAGTARVCVMIHGRVTIEVEGASGVKMLILQAFPELFDSMDMESGLGCLDLTLDGSFSIPGGSRQVPVEGAMWRLDWTGFQAVSPPDPETPA